MDQPATSALCTSCYDHPFSTVREYSSERNSDVCIFAFQPPHFLIRKHNRELARCCTSLLNSHIGYHIQRDNEDGFLSLDFGPGASLQVDKTQMRSAVTSESHRVKLKEFGHKNATERLNHYRRFLYEKGGIADLGKEQERDFKLNEFDRFRYRTRYFTDSGIIGSKEFVDRIYQQFKHYFSSKHEKHPKTIKGLEGVYSLKRLSEAI